MEAKTGTTVRDVPSHDFINAYAQHLKRSGKVELPKWVDLAKTATYKELSPYNPDWYFVRAASVARKIYLRKNTGIGALTKWYGGRARRGTRREHYETAPGSVIRHIVQQLETLGVVEANADGGRQITSQGQRDMDRIAREVRDQA